MFAALRGLEESGSLARRPAEGARDRHQHMIARRFAERAKEEDRHASVLRETLYAPERRLAAAEPSALRLERIERRKMAK